MMRRLVPAAAALGVLAFAVAAQGRAPALSDGQVRQRIIQESVADYLATGHPCACPYNTMRNGRTCGRVSAYVRPGGAAPLCYERDVTPGMMQDWRQQHGG